MNIIFNESNIFSVSVIVHLFCPLIVIGWTTAETTLPGPRNLPVGFFLAVRVQDNG